MRAQRGLHAPVAQVGDTELERFARDELLLRPRDERLVTLRRVGAPDGRRTRESEAARAVELDRPRVYRVLIDLEGATILARTDVGDRLWRFELRRETDHDRDHPHFVCITCRPSPMTLRSRRARAGQERRLFRTRAPSRRPRVEHGPWRGSTCCGPGRHRGRRWAAI